MSTFTNIEDSTLSKTVEVLRQSLKEAERKHAQKRRDYTDREKTFWQQEQQKLKDKAERLFAKDRAELAAISGELDAANKSYWRAHHELMERRTKARESQLEAAGWKKRWHATSEGPDGYSWVNPDEKWHVHTIRDSEVPEFEQWPPENSGLIVTNDSINAKA